MVCRAALAATLIAALAGCAAAQPAPAPAPQASAGGAGGAGGAPQGLTAPAEGIPYPQPFFPGSTYRDAVPTPLDLLGYPVGDRAATHAEIERCFKAWAEASDRMTLVQHGVTWEGRPLYHAIFTAASRRTEGNNPHAALKRDLAALNDAAALSTTDAAALAERVPPVIWLAYSIHGDETSGADAALAVAYHLAASEDESVRRMLGEMVVIIDPLMNPDGRDRYLAQLQQHRAARPNVDDQSLAHTGMWPYGRTNHYLFDLNRDWIFGVHPESRGRIRAIRQWNPVVLVDAHEMGAQDTYLFSPSREPINPHIPAARRWWDLFAKDQAALFDQHGWRYYTGEWNEEWYPGYSSSWAGLRGAVGILYEQAGISTDAVTRDTGVEMTYRESVHHQVVSSMANLGTTFAHRRELVRGLVDTRRQAVSEQGPYAQRSWAVIPTGNEARDLMFLDLMDLQGIAVETAQAPFTVPARDRLGIAHPGIEFPAGTWLIRNRQPAAHMAAALLEFDPRMSDAFLAESRRETLREGDERLYDVTAWSIPMYFDVNAYTLGAPPQIRTEPWRKQQGGAASGRVIEEDRAVAWVVDGADDRSLALAVTLMDEDVEIRAAEKPFTLLGRAYTRGSILIMRDDNRDTAVDVGAILDRACRTHNLTARALTGGLGAGDLPDLGGEHFARLAPPRVAMAGGPPYSSYNFGAMWHTLDHRLGIRSARIDSGRVTRSDLRRYNVLILPSASGAGPVADDWDELKAWVEAGGTLIAIDDSAAAVATEREGGGLSRVRRLPEILDDAEALEAYETDLLRDFQVDRVAIDPERIWGHEAGSVQGYPWQPGGRAPDAAEDAPADAAADPAPEDADSKIPDRPAAEELKRRDAWQSIFMPRGAVLAARADDRHWLTSGLHDYVPVLMGGNPLLMAARPVEAPVRLGVLVPGGADAPRRLGWAIMPGNTVLRLRMAGLVWPEAAERLANAAYVTRERVGAGQVILFAADPCFRGATMGPMRLFMNAVVLGPGFGASEPIPIPPQ